MLLGEYPMRTRCMQAGLVTEQQSRKRVLRMGDERKEKLTKNRDIREDKPGGRLTEEVQKETTVCHRLEKRVLGSVCTKRI